MNDGSCRGGGGYAGYSDDEGNAGTVRCLLSTLFTPLIVSSERPSDDRSDISSSSDEEQESDPSDTVLVRTAASRMRETPRARLRRLRYEMTQLERELQAEDPRGSSRTGMPDSRDLLRQLAELRDRAEGWQALVRPVPGRAGDLAREVVQGPETTRREEKARGEEPVAPRDARGGAYVAELDRRLHVLEQRIGTGTVDEVCHFPPSERIY